MKKPLFIVIVTTLLLRLVYAFHTHEIWWDEGVYIGMGKYLFSLGTAGLWEHIRPPLVPLWLGLFWKLGLPVLLLGKIVQFVLFGGIIYLTYKLAEKWFSLRVALVASVFVAFSPIFYLLGFHSYTEIPAVFFALLALWCFETKRPLFAGISIGLAFLAKFPAGMFLIPLLIVLLVRKHYKTLIPLLSGFVLVAAPYFIINWVVYGNPFTPLLAAREAIISVLGCNVLRYQPWYHYFILLVGAESKAYLFALVGIVPLIKKRPPLLFVLSLVLPLLYFIQLHCRDYRYLTHMLPFFAILAAIGIVYLFDLFLKKRKQLFFLVPLILSITLLITLFSFYTANALPVSEAARQYYSYQPQSSGEVWSANPVVAVYTDKTINKIYYPVYDEDVSLEFTDYVQRHHERISTVYLDNCGGGIICAPNDSACETRTTELIEMLDSTFTLAYSEQHGRCWFKIWESS